eukprot:9401420-Karenia_brevis.AAC.1
MALDYLEVRDQGRYEVKFKVGQSTKLQTQVHELRQLAVSMGLNLRITPMSSQTQKQPAWLARKAFH